jgi:3-hydroxyisobutyrate dehydrogenase-like beta-hydroxyacid dehydrogenase
MIKIGFIGLGNLGMPMALNLLKAYKNKVTAFDINKNILKKFKLKGGKTSSSVEELIKISDIIITCLPGPIQIKKVSFGKEKIINNLSKKKFWIDCSTNSITCFNQIKKKLGKNINYFFDATVSGGTMGAKKAALSFYIGGAKKNYIKIKKIFKKLGKNIYFLGVHGAGYSAKIAQVSLCYHNYLSLSEAIMLGVKSGIKAKTMLDIINKSASGGFVSSNYGPNMVNGNYDSGFSLGLSYKDLKLAKEIINSKKIKLPMTELTNKIYSKAMKKFGPKANHLKAIRLMEENNKLFFKRN